MDMKGDLKALDKLRRNLIARKSVVTPMKSFRSMFKCLAVVAVSAVMVMPGRAETSTDTNAPATDTNSAAALRSYVQLQEQIHAAQLAIERNREEADQASVRSVQAIAEKMQALEQSLAVQRARELEQLQGANRLMLIIGGTCAAVGFLAMLLTAYFQWRAVGRLTEFSMLSQASLTMRPALAAPGAENGSVVAEQASQRLFGALDRLEKRILDLEHTAVVPLGNGDAHIMVETETASTNGATPHVPKDERLGVLIARGQSLLNADKIEEAVGCFDEILAIEPKHAETLVKKGEALERLRRGDEAVLCYDAAIAADAGMTIAYLHKGGLFNRMERYEEALKCYEQALRTQEKNPAI